MRDDTDLTAAPAIPLVLKILSEGESYGYEILKRVRSLSDDEMEWRDGVFYPLLHRLSRLGYVSTDWRTGAEGRRRRYYAIAANGRLADVSSRLARRRSRRATNGLWTGLLHGVGLVLAHARPHRTPTACSRPFPATARACLEAHG